MKKPLKTFPLFKSIDQAFQKTYDALASSGVKVASYGIQTASSSSTDKLSRMDRIAEATWVLETARKALTDAQLACVTCTYDGIDEARADAINTLSAQHADVHANPDLVREVFIREFDFGETYSKSLREIAAACGTSYGSVFRAGNKVKAIVKSIRRDIDAALRPEFETRGWLRGREVETT